MNFPEVLGIKVTTSFLLRWVNQTKLKQAITVYKCMLAVLPLSDWMSVSQNHFPPSARLLIGIESYFAHLIKNSGVAAEASGYIA